MKGFFIFLGIIALMIGSYIYYNIKHPSDTMIVRNGMHWNILKRDINKSKK